MGREGDSLEIIIVILIVVFALVNGNKKGGKGAAGRTSVAQAVARATQRQEAAKRRALSRTDAAAEVVPAIYRNEPLVETVEGSQGASMLDDAECAGGSMAHTHDEGHSALEDADCAGGSMEHVHTEGVDRADHARRMAAIDATNAGDVLSEVIDARSLRRAVVMAEVLGKPRALRRMGR